MASIYDHPRRNTKADIAESCYQLGPNVRKTMPWSDVIYKPTDFYRAGLIGLVKDICAASKNNQAFLHMDDLLADYGIFRPQ